MRVRVSSLLVACALTAATLLLVQHRAEAAPATAVAAASIVAPTLDGASAQINFAAIVCPILLAIRNAFANSPFFSFVDAILNQLLVFFGCAPSG